MKSPTMLQSGFMIYLFIYFCLQRIMRKEWCNKIKVSFKLCSQERQKTVPNLSSNSCYTRKTWSEGGWLQTDCLMNQIYCRSYLFCLGVCLYFYQMVSDWALCQFTAGHAAEAGLSLGVVIVEEQSVGCKDLVVNSSSDRDCRMMLSKPQETQCSL